MTQKSNGPGSYFDTTNAYRAMLEEYLRDSGISGVHRARVHPRLSAAFAEEETFGDLLGLPNVVLNARSRNDLKFGAELDTARSLAEQAEADFYFAIIRRSGRVLDEHYVVTSLEVLTKLLRGERP